MDPNQMQQPMVGQPEIPQGPISVPPQEQSQGVPGAAQPITDEQKQILLGMIQKIKEKLSSSDAIKLSSQNKLELLRSNILKQIFEKLQMAGVDLSSRESVADFIMRLQQNSPELAAMFEQSMNILLGGQVNQSSGIPQDPNAVMGDPNAVMDQGIPPQNNMNNANPNEAISQNIQGPFSQAG